MFRQHRFHIIEMHEPEHFKLWQGISPTTSRLLFGLDKALFVGFDSQQVPDGPLFRYNDHACHPKPAWVAVKLAVILVLARFVEGPAVGFAGLKQPAVE